MFVSFAALYYCLCIEYILCHLLCIPQHFKWRSVGYVSLLTLSFINFVFLNIHIPFTSQSGRFVNINTSELWCLKLFSLIFKWTVNPISNIKTNDTWKSNLLKKVISPKYLKYMFKDLFNNIWTCQSTSCSFTLLQTITTYYFIFENYIRLNAKKYLKMYKCKNEDDWNLTG